MADNDPQEQWDREAARSRWWNRVYVGFVAVVSAAVSIAVFLFYMYREWWIWAR